MDSVADSFRDDADRVALNTTFKQTIPGVVRLVTGLTGPLGARPADPDHVTVEHSLEEDGDARMTEQHRMDEGDTPLTSGMATPATEVSLAASATLLIHRQLTQQELWDIFESWRLNMNSNDEIPPFEVNQVTPEIATFMREAANTGNASRETV